MGFIEAPRARWGAEPICAVLPIASSKYYEQHARRRAPQRRPARAQRDAWLHGEVTRVWGTHRRVYRARKVWKTLRHKQIVVARCTVARLMRAEPPGVVRGRRVGTTVATPSAERPPDLVQRSFQATRPNQLWVSDLTYVATWRGFIYVALPLMRLPAVLSAGGRAATSLRSDLALDALEQALYDRETDGALVHRSDRGGQYLSLRYTARLAEAGIEPSAEAGAVPTPTRWPKRSSGSTRRR